MTRSTCAVILFCVLFFFDVPTLAKQPEFSSDQALIAMGLCEDMGQKVNVLVDYTTTKCIPSLSIKGTDFIFISEQTVFAVEVSEKAWVIVVVASVGRTLNDKPSYLADKILFSDMSMLKDKNYYMIPATLAKTLQQEVYNGQISIDVMWQRITSALKVFSVAP
ncbi:MAG TPA: hypothetical protein VNV39_10340 [Stellaceae bacterium]|jgi:hypothetical protein|nr:hypothetical protein [Stellaceae bacterium]